MWLLRNSGRYRSEQYGVFKLHEAIVDVLLDANQYRGVYEPEELGRYLRGEIGLPTRELSAEFGEVSLRVSVPQEHHIDLAKLPPFLHVHARLALPLRELKTEQRPRFVYPAAVIREFCDFLTVATGSYIIAGVPEDGALPGTAGDRPFCPASRSRLPITEEWFRFDQRDVYARLFERFMGLHWRRHAALVDAFRCYRLAIAFGPSSPSTAYLLLVSAVEAVANVFSEEAPSFEDFPEQFRQTFRDWQDSHRVLPKVADDLRDRLLSVQGGTLRASRGFQQVIADYLPADFWEQTPHGGLDPAQLEVHLRAVYDARSKFAHEALEFGIEVETLGVAVIPCYAYDPATRRRRKKLQRVLTLDFFAKLTRAVLLAILAVDHPMEEDDVDPENWLLGRGILEFPADMIAPTALRVTNNPPEQG
jgi:hypothetical protein